MGFKKGIRKIKLRELMEEGQVRIQIVQVRRKVLFPESVEKLLGFFIEFGSDNIHGEGV